MVQYRHETDESGGLFHEMINEDLIRIINSEGAWAFIGSGASVSAGGPTWIDLLNHCRELLANRFDELLTEKQEETDRKKRNLPGAFQVLADQYKKSNLDGALEEVFQNVKTPGRVHEIVAKWPFAAYVTTNYDQLQEKALEQYSGGWTSVGNSAWETKKISKEVKHVVWHPHGGVDLGRGKNLRYVLTASDYDEIYPSGSPVYETLSSLLRMCRMVFIGFGFGDPDLQNLLHRMKRISSPGFPSFAFLHSCDNNQRRRMKEEYNIEVIPYRAGDGDHSDLLEVLRAYSSFVVTRDIQYGTGSIEDVGYDPCVTSLLVQNEIHKKALTVTSEAPYIITRASILSALGGHDKLIMSELVADIKNRCGPRASSLAPQAVGELESKGLIVMSEELVWLSNQGRELVSSGYTAAEFQRDQFLASVRSRIDNQTDYEGKERIAQIASEFLEQICRDRGLGVAQNLVGNDLGYKKYRAVALLQELPNWFSKCSSREEALLLVQIVSELLQMPMESEMVYLGLLTQAYFGKHLAGADMESAPLRREALDTTLFICDSSFLIPFLAKHSTGHKPARTLIDLLSTTQSKLITTDLLVTETSEHAYYALRLVKSKGEDSFEVFSEVRRDDNAFLNGYYSQGALASGQRFVSYVSDALGGGGNLHAHVKAQLKKLGIEVLPLEEWDGFSPHLYRAIEHVKQDIETRRRSLETFKHDRQVKAEAFVAVLISAIRQHRIKYPNHPSENAFFLSRSRAMDNIASLPHQRMSITPESLFQWLSSVLEMSNDRASAIFDLLLHDLAETGHNLVPKEQIVRSFSGLIEASRSKLRKVCKDHRELILDTYGQNPDEAFRDINVLEIPSATEKISLSALRDVQRRLEREQKLRQETDRKLRKMERLVKFPPGSIGRKQRALQKKRAAESRQRTKTEKVRRKRRQHARRR